MHPITPCLWFDQNAEEAVQFYLSVFPNSKITRTVHYSEVGQEHHGQPSGMILLQEFNLDGQPYLAMNGGPRFKFTEAISLIVTCDTQAEIDHYWNHLSAGGDETAQQCGWLKDKFGLSWQIVPAVLKDLMADPTRSDRTMQALLSMKKLDIAALKAA